MKQTIQCPICNKHFLQITVSHLKKQHQITMIEFKKQYPDYALVSPDLIDKQKLYDMSMKAKAMGRKGYKNPKVSAFMKGNKRGLGSDRSAEKERYRQQAIKQHKEGRFHPWTKEQREQAAERTKNRWLTGNLKHTYNPKWQITFGSILQGKNVVYFSEYRLPDIVDGKKLGKPFDFYIPANKTLIELNGCFWHGCSCSDTHELQKRVKKNDAEKAIFAAKAGYRLLVLWEHDKDKMINFIEDAVISV